MKENSYIEVEHDAKCNLNKEDNQEEGEECSQHPGWLLPRSATSEEAHDCYESSNTQEDVCGEVVVSVLVSAGLEVQRTVEHQPETHSEHSQTQQPDLEVDEEHQELEEWEASSLRSRHLEIQILWSPLLRCLCLGLLWFAAERVRVEERESSAAEPAAEAGRSGLGRSYRFTQE